jgi:two-component system sensor histidine kinase RegB
MTVDSARRDENLALRLGTLVRIRWLAILGQLLAVVFVHFMLGFELLFLPIMLVIAASAWLNLFLRFRYPGNVRWRGQSVTALLSYDILQLALLLYLTGGIQNPFSVLLAVPVVISAATQRARDVFPLLGLAVAAATLLVFFHQPLPWFTPEGLELPFELKGGIWVATLSAMGFTSIYTFRVADESRKLADALAATEIVLQREQHVTNLDGLATAAAHELGTPLATISLVSKEMLRELPEGSPMHEDALLLKSQTDRCREILKKISSLSSAEDENIANMSINLLMEEVATPYRDGPVKLELLQLGSRPGPIMRRNSAILYGIGNLLENAVDFANGRVVFTGLWNDERVVLKIEDDGPGFTSGLFERIGDPFITRRSARKQETGGGLGLGLFIAKTLLERNGATLEFENNEDADCSGARVTIAWQRSDFERQG